MKQNTPESFGCFLFAHMLRSVLYWYYMKNNIIHCLVTRGLDGFFVATAVQIPVVTQAKSLDELVVNIREAVDLYFDEMTDGTDKTVYFKPSLLLNYEIDCIA